MEAVPGDIVADMLRRRADAIERGDVTVARIEQRADTKVAGATSCGFATVERTGRQELTIVTDGHR